MDKNSKRAEAYYRAWESLDNADDHIRDALDELDERDADGRACIQAAHDALIAATAELKVLGEL